MSKTIKELSKQFKPEVVEPTKLVKINVSVEEQILEQQIRKLAAISMVGELTLEEIKKLDLLIKNKRLVNEQSTLNVDSTALPSDHSVDDLVAIAGSTENQDDTSIESPSSKDTVE